MHHIEVRGSAWACLGVQAYAELVTPAQMDTALGIGGRLVLHHRGLQDVGIAL